MPSDRVVAAAALALAVAAVAAAATAVESSLATAFEPPPADAGGDGGLSLYALLLLLLTRVLALFGVSVDLGGIGGGASAMAAAVALARAAVPHLPALLAGLALAAVLGAAVRFRSEAVAAATGTIGPEHRSDDAAADRLREWSPGDPSDAVEAAWVELVAAVDPSDPASRTPVEWRRAAVEAGLPAATVVQLASLFRAVEYGGYPVTAEREERAAALRRRVAEATADSETDA